MNSIALVDAWEDGRRRSRIERPLVLLAAYLPGTSEDEWARLPVGERDARLLGLREELFGRRLSAAANCPDCGESLDISLSTEDIRVPRPWDGSPSEFELSEGGYSVRFRLPTTADLSFIATAAQTLDPRTRLLERCIVEARNGGAPTDAAKLPASVLDLVVSQMGEADPQAIVDLGLECPACRRAWSLAFDICSYLWSEIEDLVLRLFREIHALASAYGWSELEILGMSPLRRRIYLDMVEG